MISDPKLTIKQFTSKAVGLPFKDGGRDWNGVDCYGLVVLCFRECLDIELPSYGETSAFDLAAVAGLVANKSAIEPWVSVINPQAFDVAVMHRRRAPVHVGILISATNLLHIEEKTDACIVPLSDPKIRFRYPRFYRHRELIQHAA